jgi:hypothetical protein
MAGVGAVTERRFAALLVIAYVAITLTVALHHESWRDEADGWLFARDGGGSDFLSYTRHGGTPGLWLLVLMPLAKLGLPYFSQALLHLAIATASVALLALYAPFSRLTKVLIAFSYYFAYEYAVIVRSYALTVLLTFIVAAMYPRRNERPVAFAIALFLLFNVNAQGFVIAGTFAVLFVLDKARRAVPIAIMALGAIVSVLQVRTPPDPARHAAQHIFNRDAFAWVVGNAFLPTLPVTVTFIIGMIVLGAVTVTVIRARDAVVILWLPLAGLSVVYTYIWLGGLRHAGFFLLLAIVAIWIAGDRVQRPLVATVLLNLTLLVSTFETVRYAVLDYRFAFSGAAEMAQHLTGEQRPIAAHNLTQCEALLPYLPQTRFWYAGLRETGTYLKWDSAFEAALNVPYPVAEERAKEHFKGMRWLLLFNVEMPDPAAHGFRLVYTNQKPIFEKVDEHYWLYERNR